jgi:hypothetical protein
MTVPHGGRGAGVTPSRAARRAKAFGRCRPATFSPPTLTVDPWRVLSRCLMRPRAARARVEAAPSAAARALEGGSSVGATRWPCGSDAVHIPDSARDAAAPAAHSSFASARGPERQAALVPARAAPALRLLVWSTRTGHRTGRPATPAGGRAGASAARSPQPTRGAVCASRAPARPGPDCRQSGTSRFAHPSSPRGPASAARPAASAPGTLPRLGPGHSGS